MFFVPFVRSNSYKVVEVNKLSLGDYITDVQSACNANKSVAACVGIFPLCYSNEIVKKTKDLIIYTTRTARFQ